ncbi:P-loop ATPase, Sll1717 family [Phenylobacterium sp.]|uniref:P-loop ATPase, Sll1717 family n=1 Tax=Phenylobacterium sp. TaxID=1871053 RepID=UPI002731E2B4|nr:hypothetical protein [Phenylobacterium sp.]MDP1617831.1 hypothetical protein [Phenylobacterium sp.]MDP1987579.1 hypothetical protein [Phenylobacterium sp.]
MFKKIADLDIGSIDAINYSGRKEKELLKRIFYKDAFLDRILETKKYFIVGEKGTGKTAYATYLSNGVYNSTNSTTKNINSTDYTKFYHLKQIGHLPVSDFIDTWKVILLLLLCDHIKENGRSRFGAPEKFKSAQQAIEKYYDSAFDPEVVSAIEFVKDAEISAELLVKYAKLAASERSSVSASGTKFQTNLLIIEKSLKEAISSLDLRDDHILFIDGIDVRPSALSFTDYMECVRGLAFAVWQLNTEFLANIRDSKGRIKVVLLLRPDIFDAVEFQNANAKMRDNSVNLSWITTYGDYRTSRIFQLVDGILAKQTGHDPMIAGEAWDHYFNYDVPNMRIAERLDNPFVSFLRYSFYRPRDVISYLGIMQEYVRQHNSGMMNFTDRVFLNCQKEYSDYLLGEVRDYLSFYYSSADFNELVGFFKFMKGKSKFSWDEFIENYTRFHAANSREKLTLQQLKDGPEEFIQFLYSMNVVGYDEEAEHGPGRFVHWCFRDRTPVNLSPKIPTGLNAGRPYGVHPGLVRALQVGGENEAKATHRRR